MPNIISPAPRGEQRPTPTPLTPERLAEYVALEQAATKGPWQVIVGPGDDGFPAGAVGVAMEDGTFVFAESVTDGVEILRADAKFTAAARTAVPELLAENARLNRLVKSMLATVTEYDCPDPNKGPLETVVSAMIALSEAEKRVAELEAAPSRADVLNEAADKLALELSADGPTLPGYPLAVRSAVRHLRRMADGTEGGTR